VAPAAGRENRREVGIGLGPENASWETRPELIRRPAMAQVADVGRWPEERGRDLPRARRSGCRSSPGRCGAVSVGASDVAPRRTRKFPRAGRLGYATAHLLRRVPAHPAPPVGPRLGGCQFADNRPKWTDRSVHYLASPGTLCSPRVAADSRDPIVGPLRACTSKRRSSPLSGEECT
jgi:hypothetical protein